MSGKIEYSPKGVCSVKMVVEVEDDIISNVSIIGVCPGNSLGISKLCVGMKIDDEINKLSGIDCRGRGTSCPDQLSIALSKLKESELVKN